MKFNIGDLVIWHDPDGELSTGEYYIEKINGEIYYISNEFSEAEVFEHELELIKGKD